MTTMTTATTTTATTTGPVRARPTRDVEIRYLERDDSTALLAVFDGMGPRSRELRFLAPKSRLTASDVRQLTAVDGRDHVALVALAAPDARPVGIARFIRDGDDPEQAEVALDVVDVWQRRGVGTLLARALVQRAAEVGLRRLTMSMSVDNPAAVRLLRRAPGPVSRVHADRWRVEYAVSLEGSLEGSL